MKKVYPRKIIKMPSPFLLEAFDRFMKEMGKKKVRLGEFLTWLQEKGAFRK